MSEAVLVTGGAGFIGRRLVTQLTAAGYEVHVLDPAAEETSMPAGTVPHQGSVLDEAALREAVAGKAIVFHLAAKATLWARDPDIYERVNHRGTRAVLEACGQAGTSRLIVTSTALILRDWRQRYAAPITAETPRPPLSAMPGPYARSKWLAAEAVKEAIAQGLPAMLLYPTVPIGAPEGAVTDPTEMLRQFLTRPPPAYLETRLNLVDVGDAAEAHLLAARRGRTGGEYLVAGEDLAFSAMLAHLERLSGRPMPKRRIPCALAALTAHIGERIAGLTGKPPAASIEGVRSAKSPPHFDATRTCNALGWQPRPAATALEGAVRGIRGI